MFESLGLKGKQPFSHLRSVSPEKAKHTAPPTRSLPTLRGTCSGHSSQVSAPPSEPPQRIAQQSAASA